MVRFLSNPLILKFSVDIPVLVKLKSYIQKRGQQVIDLEGLANHRGSAFGG
jgi:tRNA 2-selenouridine synthase SelU